MVLWMARDGIAYYHLGAYSDAGYGEGASFALFWTAWKFFTARHFRWLSLGGGAGLQEDTDSGLMRFKRGWSTGTRSSYFCGRILDRDAYARLVRENAVTAHGYFPDYRKGEFGY